MRPKTIPGRLLSGAAASAYLLVSVKYSERVDERKIAGDCVELGVRNEAVLVVVVVLEHSLRVNNFVETECGRATPLQHYYRR